jgi:hypothetical protein
MKKNKCYLSFLIILNVSSEVSIKISILLSILYKASFFLLMLLHLPKRKMRKTFYKKIKNRSVNLFGDINALLKSIILFDDYNQLRL